MLRVRTVAFFAPMIVALLSTAAMAEGDSREAPVTPQEYWEAIQNPPLCARNDLALKAIEMGLQELRNTPGRRLMIETKNELLCAMADGDVKTLERLTDGYAKDGTLNFGGSWKIGQFMEVISYFLEYGKRDQQLAHWQALYKKWISVYPKSPMAPIAHANALQDEAWSYRGESSVDNVRDDAWASFGKYQKIAQKVLLDNRTTASANPEWYASIISIMGELGASRNELLAIAREGIKKYPEYHRTYEAMMRMLTPKWGGDVDSMEAWAREAVEATKAVTGMSAYADAYEYVLRKVSNEEAQTYKVDWAYYSSSADELLKYYPSMETVDTSLKVSCYSHDPNVVLKRIAQIDRYYMSLTHWSQVSWKKDPPEKFCRWNPPAVQIPNTGVVSPEELFLKKSHKQDGWQ